VVWSNTASTLQNKVDKMPFKLNKYVHTTLSAFPSAALIFSLVLFLSIMPKFVFSPLGYGGVSNAPLWIQPLAVLSPYPILAVFVSLLYLCRCIINPNSQRIMHPIPATCFSMILIVGGAVLAWRSTYLAEAESVVDAARHEHYRQIVNTVIAFAAYLAAFPFRIVGKSKPL
jgi:hypothetical protein